MIKTTYRLKLWVLTLLGVAFFFGAAACSQKDDVAVIRELIKKGAALAEDHNVSEMMELTTDDVTALPGRHNRLAIKRILWMVFKRYGQFKVLYPRPSVDLSGEDNFASCTIYVLIVKKDRNIPGLKELTDDPKRWLETVGENADLYQVKLELLKKDSDWLVRKAHLESFRGLDFGD
jgi:hypothetical protein